jgi:hypothetical protein
MVSGVQHRTNRRLRWLSGSGDQSTNLSHCSGGMPGGRALTDPKPGGGHGAWSGTCIMCDRDWAALEGVAVEKRYCSNCGNRLEPDARFCSSCGRAIHRGTRTPAPEDVPTSQLPTSLPPSPQHQPREAQARGGIMWHRGAGAQDGTRWPLLALVGVLLILVAGEIVQVGMLESIRVVLIVAAVVLVASGVSYISLIRRNGAATFREAVFNWSVVVLAAFAAFLFFIS